MPSSTSEFNARVIDEFRAHDGHVGGSFEGLPILLLHHTGAKSGQSRVNPLAYPSDEDRYVIFASKGGAPTNPAWYHNVRAHPNVRIEVGTDTIEALASEAEGAERERLYGAQAERIPQFATYAQRTDRLIPVIVLTPIKTT